MDLELLKKLEIPQEQKERNKVLTDALETGNPLLIDFALAIGAETRVGGVKLLEYAVKKGDQKLVERQMLYIEAGPTMALNQAIDNDQVEIGTWLAQNGAVMFLNQPTIKKHVQTVTQILRNSPDVRVDVKYGALLESIFLKNGAEVLTMLFSSMEKHTPWALKDWIVRLADDTADTDRVDCMEIMIKFGLDAAYVNTKYCKNKKMRAFLKENGARID